MADTTEDLAKKKKAFLTVGVLLFIFTFIALALGKWSVLDFGPPGATGEDILTALIAAAVKASLVGLVFMHLSHEKGVIYKILLFSFFFFMGLMILTIFTQKDPILEQFDTLKTTSGALLQKPE